MKVVAIYRYPVKAMAAERLDEVETDHTGLEGDRNWAVYGDDGRLVCGKDGRRFRRNDAIFDLAARTVDGNVEVELPGGLAVRVLDPESDQAVSDHLGEPVEIRPETTTKHKDDSDVSIVGTATLAALGRLLGHGPVDARHLRANIVVETDEPYVEDGWLDREVTIGSASFVVAKRVTRCRTVDLAQVDVAADPGLLKAIGAEREAKAAIYLAVLTEGRIAVGDAVTVGSDSPAAAAELRRRLTERAAGPRKDLVEPDDSGD